MRQTTKQEWINILSDNERTRDREHVEEIAARFDAPPRDAEEWYRRAVEFYRADLEAAAKKEIPPFHISSGFTVAGGRDTKVAGQCFPEAASADGLHHIFLNPRYVEPIDLINTVIHEVIHATVGNDHGHGAGFSRVAARCGMVKPWKATRWGDIGRAKAEAVCAALGKFPRAAFVAKGIKKQPSRLLKAICPECGYVVRLSKVWAEMGLPFCGVCSEDGELVRLALAD